MHLRRMQLLKGEARSAKTLLLRAEKAIINKSGTSGVEIKQTMRFVNYLTLVTLCQDVSRPIQLFRDYCMMTISHKNPTKGL